MAIENPTSHYKDTAVAESYDNARFTSLSGRSFDRLEKRHIRKAFRDVAPGSLVLDAPCGTGRLAEVLLELGFRVVGMDISDAMLAVARKKLARFGNRFTTTTADLLASAPSGSDRYDAALCARVLMHLPLDQQMTFLGNVARLTHGPVVFTQSWSSGYQRLRRQAKRALRNQPPVRYPVSRAELSQLTSGAGLQELRRLRPFPLLTEEIIVVAQPALSRRSAA